MAYSIHKELSVIGFGGSSHGEIDIELTDRMLAGRFRRQR